MHEEAILKIDQAAVTMLQTLDTYGDDLQSCLASQELARLRGEIVNLRQVLLGLEMGILYQDWDPASGQLKGEMTDICAEAIPLEAAAAQVKDLASRTRRNQDNP
jgi:hypothetical protein